MSQDAFEKEWLCSGMAHFKMLPDRENSLKEEMEHAEVAEQVVLWDGQDLSRFTHAGPGEISTVPEDGAILMKAPSRTDRWPEGAPEDGDYCNFGASELVLHPAIRDWRSCNRITLEARPLTRGLHSPVLSLRIRNDGEKKIPDRYMREGFHMVHLRRGEWNRVIWEFPSLPRDCVTELAFRLELFGRELAQGAETAIEIRNIRLEETRDVRHTVGWETDPGRISHATNGYSVSGKKTALTSDAITAFRVLSADDGKTVFQGKPEAVLKKGATFFVMDFTGLSEPGDYVLEADRAEDGNVRTGVFSVEEDPWKTAVLRTLNFIYSERCGCPVGNGHGSCHSDILARHGGKTVVYNGGWHDAGDVSQQTLQTGEITLALMKIAARYEREEPSLHARLMEEAAWGMDFVLKTRFGDGFRATSAGICRWTDNMIGTMDDCAARVHDHAFENFVLAAVEAEGAEAFRDLDPALSEGCLDAAACDLMHAERVFSERGPELPVIFEHSFNSSFSLHLAAAVLSEHALYRATGTPEYRDKAERFGRELLLCQETDEESPACGLFHRDRQKKSAVHFNHQSRSFYFAGALRALCEIGSPGAEHALRLHGEYLRRMAEAAYPYGMMPAGLHRKDEPEDGETFALMHLYVNHEEEKENYRAQLAAGEPACESGEWVLRQFPVWFSFRGNEAVCLSDGISAAIAGGCLGDRALTDAARDQLYWTFGRNPFCQSLMSGEGRRHPALYGALNGETAGSLPVGIETRENEDVPFWPVETNATYKEVWTSSSARLLLLLAELHS